MYFNKFDYNISCLFDNCPASL